MHYVELVTRQSFVTSTIDIMADARKACVLHSLVYAAGVPRWGLLLQRTDSGP